MVTTPLQRLMVYPDVTWPQPEYFYLRTTGFYSFNTVIRHLVRMVENVTGTGNNTKK